MSDTATSMVRLSAVAIKIADIPIIRCPFKMISDASLEGRSMQV
jgi:hypothetical protein